MPVRGAPADGPVARAEPVALSDEQVQQILVVAARRGTREDVLGQLIRLLPPQTDLGTQGRHNTGLLLFAERCRFVASVARTGWKLNSKLFEELFVMD